MAIGADGYLTLLQDLLPPGAAWTREPDAGLTKLLAALAEELSRIDARTEDLIREANPMTTTELLTDWERVAGLPDACTGQLETVQQRRDALVARLSDTGDQSAAFYIALAASLGFTVTIEEGVGTPGTDEWAFQWHVHAPEVSIRYARAGEAVAGDPIRSWGNDLLECAFNRRKQAHMEIVFVYA